MAFIVKFEILKTDTYRDDMVSQQCHKESKFFLCFRTQYVDNVIFFSHLQHDSFLQMLDK